MKKSVLLLLTLALGIMMSATFALADSTYDLYYDGAGANESYDVYVYPYYVQINGGHNINVMCDAANRDISKGDGYTVTITAFSDITEANVQSLLWGDQGFATYMAAGYLYEQGAEAYANGNLDPNGYFNWAVWYIFDPTTTSHYLDSLGISIVQALIADAQVATAGKTPSDFAWSSSVYLYTPTGSFGQEFYGAPSEVPEPGTLMMLGSGVLGAAGLLRRKFSV